MLLDRNGEPKITDFGLAKHVKGESQLTTTGQILGTPSYMPPEQAAGDIGAIGPAADIYSLGAVLYALLTGRPPFQSDNPLDTLLQVREREPIGPRQLNPKVPADLETVCLKCLEKSATRRYESAYRLVEELGRYLRGEPILARPIGTVERGWRWCRRNPMVAGLATGIAALLVVGTITATIAAVRFKSLAEEQRQTAERERDAKQQAVEASLAAASAQKMRESERNAAQAAKERSLDSLSASLYQQAVAVGISAKPGRRWAALELLKSAEALRRDGVEASGQPGITAKEPALAVSLPSRSDLRTEAVAALLTQDARLAWQQVWETTATPASVSPAAEIAAVPWLDAANAASSKSRGIHVVNLTDGSERQTVTNPKMWGHTLAVSPDGRLLAVPSQPSPSQILPLQVWDLAGEAVLKELKFPEEDKNAKARAAMYSMVSDVAFSPSGRFLAAFRNDSIAGGMWRRKRRVARLPRRI